MWTLYNCVPMVLQVLVWKTNFDNIDYHEVLQSHRARSNGEVAPPTVHDIAPRIPHSRSTSSVSYHSVLFHKQSCFVEYNVFSSSRYHEILQF